MGLFLKQNEQRSQLQTKIAADLSARLNKEPGEIETKKAPPTILDNQRQTSPLAWIWIVLGVLAIIGAIVVLTR
jgi:hypothetical protein